VATRDVGYYVVHYTNLDTINFGTKTGISPAYWDGSRWHLHFAEGQDGGWSNGGLSTDDSHIDHVSPPLTEPPAPSSSAGWYWVKPVEPRDADWHVAWRVGGQVPPNFPAWYLLRADAGKIRGLLTEA
jgi:hypothetical protein